MNTSETAPTPPALPPLESTSSYARMANVFVTPAETFEEVAATPRCTLNWLLPTILAGVIGAVCVWVLFSQPAMQQQIREAQSSAIESKVKAGKLTRQQADAAIEAIERFAGPRMMQISGSIGAIVSSFARLFWYGLVIWLIGKWLFKANFDYMKGVEITGLACMVSTLGSIVSLLLAINLDRMHASPGLALLIREFDPTNATHMAMASINLFTLWFLTLLGVGAAKLMRASYTRPILCVLGFWIVQQSILIVIAKAQASLL